MGTANPDLGTRPCRNTSHGEHLLGLRGYHGVLLDAVIFLTSLMVFLIKPQMVELDEYVKTTASI